jgi:hypothetical protein
MDISKTFHVLIATIGRPSLQRMLDSLSPQLLPCDHLTVVFDGEGFDSPADISKFVCQVHIIHQTPNLGSWGHVIRNKYAKRLEKTDFVMHGDDDDYYTEGTFDYLREACDDTSCLYIARNRDKDYISKINIEIKTGSVGTHSGIIPYDLNTKGYWVPCLGGDGYFYEGISALATRVGFLDRIIYHVRDTI